MAMTINLLKIALKDYLMVGKFIVLQLVLIFAKLQGLAARVIVWTDLLPCKPPITPIVYSNCKHFIKFSFVNQLIVFLTFRELSRFSNR